LIFTTSIQACLDWQCFQLVAQNSPQDICLTAMVADYSSEVKNIEIWAPAFFKHNNLF
jgi:hypothetical protein